VTLDGAGSSDPDGDALTYTWHEGGTLLGTSRDPVTTTAVMLGLGVHTVDLTVTDGAGGSATASVVVTVAEASSPQCEADLAAALQRIADRDAQIAGLQGQLAAANQTIGDQAAQIEQLRDANARLLAETDMLRNENASLGWQLDVANQTIADQSAQLAALRADNDALRAALDAANQAIAARDAQIAQLLAQITQLEAQVARLQTQNGQLTAQVADLQAQIVVLQAEVTRLTNENQTLSAALNGALAAIQLDLQLSFSDPAFVLPGATTLDRLQNLVTALVTLERGRKLGVYTNLGGRAGR
jgi:chromosome segregation ATPase